MKWKPMFILIGYTLLMIIGVGNMEFVKASYGYEDNSIFVNHENVTILEKVEDNLGNPCNDCRVNLTLIYPNESMYVVKNMNMTSLNATGHYNSSAIENMTTLGVYTMLITADRNTASGKFNGTSDRASIRVVDVYPEPQSNWEIAVVGMAIISGFIFIFLSQKVRQNEMQIVFYMLGLTMPLVALGMSEAVLISNLGNDDTLVSFMNRIFTTYAWAYAFMIAYTILIIFKSLARYFADIDRRI